MARKFLNTEEALEIILRDGSDLEEKMSDEEVDSGGKVNFQGFVSFHSLKRVLVKDRFDHHLLMS